MFICSECGYKSVKWIGRCPVCNSWESFSEEKSKVSKGRTSFQAESSPQLLGRIENEDNLRIPTGIAEFDRILGGGLIKGEVVLVGGEPGVGKSTLLLQVAGLISRNNKVLYVSAEESPQQVNLRAKRLKFNFDNLYIIDDDNIVNIYTHFEKYKFSTIIIDSIQVVHNPDIDNPRGSINQIRNCAEFLTRFAKTKGVSIIIVGHVTKEGSLAGPKILEHIVDCVLYFESEVSSHYRILRAVKNRFGSTGEMAVFEMTSSGLKEVKVLSDIFLPHKDNPVSGSCVSCAMEGLRPILIELQALVSKATFGMVRRRSVGFDFNRFSLLTATVEKRIKIPLAAQDIFLNVAGGVRITDPAVDLAVVCAIVSSFKEKELEKGAVFIGEVGLAGELRPVGNIAFRLKEVQRGGFIKCYIPKGNTKEIDNSIYSFDIVGLESAKEVLELTLGGKV